MTSIHNAVAPFRVLIAGGSYAGLSSAVNLLDLCHGRSPRMAQEAYAHHPNHKHIPVDITIVDERDGFFHLIGAPLAFASTEYASKTWTKFSDIPALQRPNVRFLQGSLSSVDPASKTATLLTHVTKEPQSLSYDFFVAATGLRRPFPSAPQSLLRKQYLLEAEDQVHAVSNAPDGVIVVGGGAVGIEMAAELKLVRPSTKVTLVHSRDKLLSSEGLPDETKDRALELTREMDVEVLLERRVKATRELADPSSDGSGARKRYEVELSDGSKLPASEVIVAISRPVPSTSFLPGACLDEAGYVNVRSSLFLEPGEGVANPEAHLVAGDVIKWSGIKRAGGAMHMGHLSAFNMHQRMLAMLTANDDKHEPVFKELGFIPPMIGLAVGKKAVAYGPEVGTISGEDVMHAYFKDDLGFSICWNYMQLGKSPADEESTASVQA